VVELRPVEVEIHLAELLPVVDSQPEVVARCALRP
jgi:hypothetical protein